MTDHNRKDFHHLESAQQYVLQHQAEGVICPCCDRYLKVYKRSIYKAMVESLIMIVAEWRRTGDWVHITKVPLDIRGGGDISKLAAWKLLFEKKNGEGKGRMGFWMPTKRGLGFLDGAILVPKTVVTCKNKILRFEGPDISVYDAYGEHFNLERVMGELR